MAAKKDKKPKAVRIPKEKEVEKPSAVFINKVPTLEEAIKRIQENTIEVSEEKIKEPILEELSLPAQKWKDYLRLQGLTPRQFLIKYPVGKHRFRYLVEEIVAFEKKLENKQ